MASPSPDAEARRDWGLALLLAVVTLLVYAGVGAHDFVDYDDDVYVTENAHVRAGLTGAGLRWAFELHGYAGNWHPLTWLSHMLDVQLFGLEAGAHHWVSVVLHAVSGALLFATLRALALARAPSLLVAALFAWHPLRVEAVAWVAERKEVLAGVFFLLTLLAYARWVKQPSVGRYAAVVVALSLGLLAKPMLVTLPFVLLLIDAWPLQRAASWRRLTLEKLPLILLVVTSSVLTFVAQAASRSSLGALGLVPRVENALVAYGTYLWQTIWPAGLAVYYPHAALGEDPGLLLPAIGCGLLLAGVSVFAWTKRRTVPALLIGWLWFLGMLVPVIGLVQVGTQAHADRYTYLPAIGLGIAIVFSAAKLVELRPGLRPGAMLLGMAAASACLGATWHQVRVWRNTETLFEHAIAVTEANHVAHFGLGVAARERGDQAEALRRFEAAVAILPSHSEALAELGTLLLEENDLGRARSVLERARALGIDDADLCFNLGLVAQREMDLDRAEREYRAAIARDPDHDDAWNNLGQVLLLGERTDEAVGAFREVVRIAPEDPAAHFNLGAALTASGELSAAAESYRRVLAIDPDSTEAARRLAALEARVPR